MWRTTFHFRCTATPKVTKLQATARMPLYDRLNSWILRLLKAMYLQDCLPDVNHTSRRTMDHLRGAVEAMETYKNTPTDE